MTRSYRDGPAAFNLIISSSPFLDVDSLYAKNIVKAATTRFTANPVRLTDMEVSEFFYCTPI